VLGDEEDDDDEKRREGSLGRPRRRSPPEIAGPQLGKGADEEEEAVDGLDGKRGDHARKKVSTPSTQPPVSPRRLFVVVVVADIDPAEDEEAWEKILRRPGPFLGAGAGGGGRRGARSLARSLARGLGSPPED